MSKSNKIISIEKAREEIQERRHGQLFSVQLEDGRVTEAELLTTVTIDGKEYAVYSIRDEQDASQYDILASYVKKDEEGYDMLADIDDPSDKKKISDFVISLVSPGQR